MADDAQSTDKEPNPYQEYVDDIVQSVPSLLCICIGDNQGVCRLHATKDTDWNQWKHLTSLHSVPDQLEQTLHAADKLPRKLNRTTLFLDDYIILQQAIYCPPAANAAPADTADMTAPVVIISLVGKAEDGEGDIGALVALLDRLQACPMFQAIAEAVSVAMSYEYGA